MVQTQPMQQQAAIAALGALAQATRLQLYRLLVPEGARGMSAGNIAERLGVAPSSLSFHLTNLVEAGLISQQRVGRQLIYAVVPAAIGELRKYLAGLAR
jgi:ArsR family transcriptional regulator, arsenate/arsenite/antimonite-responsive transcriptional repressor